MTKTYFLKKFFQINENEYSAYHCFLRKYKNEEHVVQSLKYDILVDLSLKNESVYKNEIFQFVKDMKCIGNEYIKRFVDDLSKFDRSYETTTNIIKELEKDCFQETAEKEKNDFDDKKLLDRLLINLMPKNKKHVLIVEDLNRVQCQSVPDILKAFSDSEFNFSHITFVGIDYKYVRDNLQQFKNTNVNFKELFFNNVFDFDARPSFCEEEWLHVLADIIEMTVLNPKTKSRIDTPSHRQNIYASILLMTILKQFVELRLVSVERIETAIEHYLRIQNPDELDINKFSKNINKYLPEEYRALYCILQCLNSMYDKNELLHCIDEIITRAEFPEVYNMCNLSAAEYNSNSFKVSLKRDIKTLFYLSEKNPLPRYIEFDYMSSQKIQNNSYDNENATYNDILAELMKYIKQFFPSL